MKSLKSWTLLDLMTLEAARQLTNDTRCFVGIGLPSIAANVARRLHAPQVTLIYESGCIGSKPTRLPLSIGDGDLADGADAVVSVPEMFAYWLQPGRIDTGFLGAAQIDRFANINTTVIGEYNAPSVRLPGAGGAPEIAANCGRTIITVRQSLRTFVGRLEFVTSIGHGGGSARRRELGLPGGGPTMVITDLGVLEPADDTGELQLSAIHPGVDPRTAIEATGWPLRVAPQLRVTDEPTQDELEALRHFDTS